MLLMACGSPDNPKNEKGNGTSEQSETSRNKKASEKGGGEAPESKKKRVQNAVEALPKGKRDGALVLGHSDGGPMDTLRKGSNEFICLADDPEKEGFSAACYHKELEAFMRLGRKLDRQGKGRKEKFEARKKAIESGRIEMPDKSTLYVMSGEYDEQGNVVNSYTRYVVYIPYATPESTGLPKKAHTKGGPWIMDPGTHKAHIMVNPAK